MIMKADGPRKRRQYAIAEVKEILQAVKEEGVVEAARRHGVPQTTVSNWLHRDAAKVAATVTPTHASASTVKPTRKTMQRASTAKAAKATAAKVAKATTSLKATAALKVAAPAKASKKTAGLAAAAVAKVV